MRLIAELGSNHNGSLERALDLVETAAQAGFTDVKTQAWTVQRLFSPEALEARPELRARAALEVPPEWHRTLSGTAHALGMRYGVTPCSVVDLEECLPYADWLKVSSYSLLDAKLLEAIGRAGKPVVMSTGMATTDDVSHAVYELGPGFDTSKDLTLLHCVSSYPAPAHEANLRSIPYMRKRFECQVGWSDHTVSQVVVCRARFVHGAEMLEMHWDLDDRLGPESAHSWTPSSAAGLKALPTTSFVDEGYYACDGKRDVKAPSVTESRERLWRADPSDGLRPLLEERARLRGEVPIHALEVSKAGSPDGDELSRQRSRQEERGV